MPTSIVVQKTIVQKRLALLGGGRVVERVDVQWAYSVAFHQNDRSGIIIATVVGA